MIINFKKIATISFLIFIFGFILRLIYILSSARGPILPGSDQELYLSATQEVYGVLSHFKVVMREFLQGNLAKGRGVLNSYGLLAPVTVYRTGLFQPLIYSIIFLIFGVNNFLALSIAQGFLGSLTCVMVYLLGRALFSNKVAFTAAIISAIYFPFISFTNTPMQETSITFMLLSTILFLVKAIQNRSTLYFFFASFSLFLLITGRLAFMYSCIPLLLVLVYILKKEQSFVLWRKGILGIILGFLMPLFLWMKLVSIDTHKFGTIMFNTGPVSYIQCNSVIKFGDTEGWFYFTDEDRSRFGPHLTKWLKEQGLDWDDKKSGWPPPNICYQAVMREINKDKVGFLALYISKIANQWWRPQGYSIFDIIHRVATILLPIGFILAFFKQRLSLFLSVTIIYLALATAFIIIDPRYNLPIMPLVFIISSFTFYYLGNSFLFLNKKKRLSVILILLVGIVSYALSLFLKVPNLLLISKKITPSTAFLVSVGLRNIFIALSLFAVYLIGFRSWGFKGKIVLIYLLIFYGILFNSWVYTDGIRFNRSWREWYVELKDERQYIRQLITIDPTYLTSLNRAFLQIDMQQIQEPIGKLLVLVNGKTVKEYNTKLTVDNKGYTYYWYDYIIKDPAKMRRWFTIPLDLSILNISNVCKIEVIHKDSNDKYKGGVIRVYGDYPTKDSDKFFIGPLFARNDFETSFYNLIWGDYRITGKVRLRSRATISGFYDGSNLNFGDLSTNRGIQNGSYRIRLELIDKNEDSMIF